MKQSRWLALAFLSALAQGGLHAYENVDAAAGKAFPAVQEPGSARAIALGSTYVGIAEGSASLPWNAAGLAGLCAAEASLHHNSTLVGSLQETAILALPIDKRNVLGASLTYTDNGAFEGRDSAGNLIGDYSSNAYGLSLGWGMQAMKELQVGAAVKVNRQDLAGSPLDAYAVDLGVLWLLTPDLSIGMAYNNIGPDVAGAQLSQGLDIGLSAYLLKGSDFQWLLAISGKALNQSDGSLHFGVESTLYQVLSLRGGYSLNLPDLPRADGTVGWTLGGGVKLGTFSLDYAFVPLADIGNVQRVSLTYAFGDCAKAPGRKR